MTACDNMDNETIRRQIAERSETLARVRAELKAELFGIDGIIDRVIESVRAWYVLPAIVQRPVIVCLWGLTGTGKTQLVRLLAQKLGLYDRFVEVQMDGFSHGSGYWNNSISGMLAESGIVEGEPGILLLDEFQRFRTINDKGADLKVERYQDVWALLSDGRLPPALSFMNDLEDALAGAQFEEDEARAEEDGEPDAAQGATAPKRQRVRRFKLRPYEARELQRSLKLKDALLDIMAWSPDEVRERLHAFRQRPDQWGTDYSRLLVFVAGNLDEMYRHVATRVEDCDTDADIFHRYTRRLSMVDVKKALAERFKPEQVSRLGNIHMVYPSLDRAAYERLIAALCARYADEVGRGSGLRIVVDPAVRAQIYANAVFPAQGTRPLFSSVHGLLTAPLVDAALWAFEQGALRGDTVGIGLAPGGAQLRVRWQDRSRDLPAGFELSRLKQRSNADFRALLAVHEAGHALLYGLLLGQVPLEVKINVASFDGGYNSFLPLRARSRRDVLDTICVGLGGRAAEVLVFGPNACTSGAEQDLRQATADAAEFVRSHGFAGRLSRTDVGCEVDCEVNTGIEDTNAVIERIVAGQYNRAQHLLQDHAALLARLSRALVEHGEIPRAELAAMLGLQVQDEPAVLAPYAQRLATFAHRQLDARPVAQDVPRVSPVGAEALATA